MVSNVLKSKLIHFSVDHNDIFDQEYCIDRGNLFNTFNMFFNFKEPL